MENLNDSQMQYGNRSFDMEAEQEVSKFLDDYYYSKLSNDRWATNRITDREMQLSGIDLIFQNLMDGAKYFVDEKTALHFLKVLPDDSVQTLQEKKILDDEERFISFPGLSTFAFEINSFQKERGKYYRWGERYTKPVLGWFMDKAEKKTDFYMLGWVVARNKAGVIEKKYYKTLKSKDILCIELMLIKKAELKDFLKKEYQIDDEWLLARDDHFRSLEERLDMRKPTEKDKEYIESEDDPDGMFRIQFSPNYPEMPTNLVIPKTILQRVARHHRLVTRKGIYDFKGQEE